MSHSEHSPATNAPNAPYAVLGAGDLASSLWKFGDCRSGWRYRFNLYRMPGANGRVSQRFVPADVPQLVRLCHLLALTLADDGCLPGSLRQRLIQLAADLESIDDRNRS